MKTIRNKGRLLPVLLFLLLSIALHAQQESHVEENPEKYFTDAESAAESGLIPYLELQDYHPEKPLDINKATAGELLEPGVISAQLIAGLISYREQLGPFLNNYELQAIPGWELEDIRKLLQYARVLTGIDTRQQQLSEGFLSGTNDLVVRWGTSGRNSDRYGQSLNSEGPYFTRALRYRHTFDGRMSYGITAESDPGEAIFRKSNRHGFDFYSAHLYIRQLGPRVRSLALGDYSARFGQGLLLQSGFAPGKSAETALLARNGRKINQYTAFGEALFFRGAGATLACGKKTELTVFYSSRRRDANTKVLYSPDSSRMETIFTSFQTSGLHRDSTEVADEKTVREQTGGVSLTYISQSGQISVNTLNILFDKSWAPAPAAYRLYTFRGRYLGAGSADYQWRYRNLFLFGETAVSGNGGVSTLNGAIASVHKNATITVMHRQLGARYQSVYAAPFAEVSGASNENGLFLGADVRWTRRWQINAYADVWRHPWLRYGVNAPSAGHEYLARVQWQKGKVLTASAWWQSETKQANDPAEGASGLISIRRDRFRVHVISKISMSLESRSRAEWSWYRPETGGTARGFMAYQEFVFRPVERAFSGSFRYTVFDTDSYDSRIYTYENDLFSAVSIPAFSGSGSRVFVNLKWRLSERLKLEGRFEETRVRSRIDTQENVERAWKIQARYQW